MSHRYAGGFINANGNANYSGSFNGTTSYLSLAGAAQYAVTTSTTPFTIEGWVRVTVAGSVIFAEQQTTGSNTVSIACSLATSNDVSAPAGLYPAFGWFNGTTWTTAAASTTAIAINIWTHVAFVFTGSTSKIYINGVDVTKTSAPTPATTWGITGVNGDNWYIGKRWDTVANQFFAGSISNFRFVNGTAVYTSNFAPPAKLSAVTNTALLTCQSATFVDNSTYNATITNNGSASVVTDNPFYLPSSPALGEVTPGVWTLRQAFTAIKQRTWNMFDTYFNRVGGLFHGTGTNGAANNTILDSSTTNYTVTRVGGVAQGSASPVARPLGYWSAFFGGTNNYATVTGTTIATTTTTFTVEAWIYITNTAGANPAAINDSTPASTTYNWGFGPTSLLKVAFAWYNTSLKTATGSTTLSTYTWYHIALSVSANNIQIFVNGVPETLTGTTTLTNRDAATGNLILGQAATSHVYTGFLSNVSILNGTAKYSAAFTPTTQPLPTGTTNQVFLGGYSPIISDRNTATTAKTVTSTNTNPIRGSAFCPFFVPTVYTPSKGGIFNFGSSGYLEVVGAASDGLAFGTGDFTIEMWFFATTLSNFLYDSRTGASQVTPTLFFSGTTIQYYASGSTRITSDNVYAGRWYYLALSRVSGVTKMFLNGVQTGSDYADTFDYINNTNRPRIGCAGNSSTAIYVGFIADLRVRKGVGTTTSTVPTAPLTAIANTTLLLSGTNAAVYDPSTNVTMATVNTTVSTAQSKYGSGSLSFNGTTSYCRLNTPYSTAASSTLIPNVGNITIEAWVNPTSTAATSTFFSLNAGTNGFAGVAVAAVAGGAVRLRVSNAAGTSWTIDTTSTTIIPTGTWTHLAYVRNGGTMTLYFNGLAIITSTTIAAATLLNTQIVGYLGAIPLTATTFTEYFSGYISDFRMTSYARYTSTFVPPTSALQNQ